VIGRRFRIGQGFSLFSPGIRSRAPLALVGPLAVVVALCRPAVAAPPPLADKTAKSPKSPKVNRNAPVELFAINSQETLHLRLRDDKGRPLRGVQKRFDRLLRCNHTKKQHAMNPRLVRVLFQVGKHYPGRRLELISGYRHPSVAKNPRSPHIQGQACDFRISGVKNTDLRDYLRRDFQKVGVGYYPNSSFVHLDIRKDRSAFWIDYSGPGERAVYSENAAEDLRSGRADSYKPTKIATDWVNEPIETGDDSKPGSDDPPVGPPDDLNNAGPGAVEAQETKPETKPVKSVSGAAP